jgi:hypothetical protein
MISSIDDKDFNTQKTKHNKSEPRGLFNVQPLARDN